MIHARRAGSPRPRLVNASVIALSVVAPVAAAATGWFWSGLSVDRAAACAAGTGGVAPSVSQMVIPQVISSVLVALVAIRGERVGSSRTTTLLAIVIVIGLAGLAIVFTTFWWGFAGACQT